MARQKACDCCHSRKIHCDNAIPQCNWCKHHGLACTYDRVNKRAARASSTKRRLVKALEPTGSLGSAAASPCSDADAVVSIARAPAPTSPSTRSRTDTIFCINTARDLQPASNDIHFSSYKLSDISSHCGIPLFSAHGREWLKARTGEDVGNQIVYLVEALQGGRRITQTMLSEFMLSRTNLDLPPRAVVDSCLEAYRTSHFQLVFPIVEHMLFAQIIDAAYTPQKYPVHDGLAAAAATTSLDHITAKASIFAFLSVLAAARVEFRDLTPEIDGDASSDMPRTMYHLFTGQMGAAMKTHAMGCRMLFILGAHMAPTPPDENGRNSIAWRVKSYLRTVFWLCYTFDKDIALRTGQPPCIEDEHCDLTLPEHYTKHGHHCDSSEEQSNNIDLSTSSPCPSSSSPVRTDGTEAHWLPGDLRLVIIKSKTYRMLYSAAALRKPDAELVRDIRELDEEVERWRLSVPAYTRPQLFYAQAQPLNHDNMPRSRLVRRTILHFEYHYLLATIHRAVSRCRTWGVDGDVSSGGEDEIKGLGSSLSLSVEASRATIFYLRLAIKTLFEDAFWLVVSYPMSATMTIFGNIMMHPLHPRSREDLQLLNITPELLKQMRPPDWTPNELANMQIIESFIAELIRLGDNAITKATRDRDSDGKSVGR
ncbi:c6 zinc finger domain containing protein [Grosmannia clavigera kw1407]|uniref:C6 zinc finger domain containing protein n=1 Tax=Grosmannia clavigera (strain kw1407 / UAMH 11150) TaxID=655863 RepID=F0XRV8_GROCL|nr:c6 zinc finger domain containing protein [Grosmannia clavigera kw1407]EFW99469.1 c6 zinc finger domain containing protein [Grosmannia clavigera kw1407]